MRRRSLHAGSLIKLKPEFKERYIILHKHTFPGVLKRIRKSNIQNYTIFLKDGVLFSHLEYVGSHFSVDMKRMGTDETTRDWWKLTDPMQEPFPSRKRGDWWASMDLVSQFDQRARRTLKTRRSCFSAEILPGTSDRIRDSLGRNEQVLAANFSQALVQHQYTFVGIGRICLYFECATSGLNRKHCVQMTEASVRQWYGGIKKFLKTPLTGMAEVFHTEERARELRQRI